MNKLIKFLATGFGSGYSPCLPGTAGSLVAALFVYFYKLDLWHILILILLGIYICNKAELLFKKHDSPHIVFDEFCGIFIATWKLTTPLSFVTAFILFRFFDMTKPYPINKLQVLPGGLGIMADDIAAGLIARFLVEIIFIIF